MSLVITQTGSVTSVTLEGSIDSRTTPALWTAVEDLVVAARSVLLDMTRVVFLSSAGLRMLLLIYREITARQGRVVLVGVSAELQAVMANTGFLRFFELAETKSQALSILS